MPYRLAAALVATITSVAIAHLVPPVPEAGTTLPDSRTGWRSEPEIAATSVVPVRSASLVLDETRAPVPIMLTRHASNASPKEAPWAIGPQENDVVPAGDFVDEGVARAAIEADGYKGVRALSRGADGVWKAHALRGQTDVTVRVDAGGNVSAN